MIGEHCFQNAMAQAGLHCKEQLINDGKLHRFRAEGDHKKNSWYILGPDLTWGMFGCWKRGVTETWHSNNGEVCKMDRREHRRKLEEARAALQRETSARQAKAAQTAEWIVRRSEPAKSHPYLLGKRVKAYGELRQRGDLLVVPLRDINGQLHTIQSIAPDNRFEGERNKTFLKGGRIAGCSFTIGDNRTHPLVICEGLATGASIHETTGHAVVCAMNAGNLKAVAENFRKKYPDCEIIIAADNDQWTDGNPGLTKASEAAKAIRAKLAVPCFNDVANKPTDFNDLHQQEGLQAVKSQIDSAALPTESDAETFERLASLSPADYDRARKTEAKRLGIQTSTLDAEVSKRRSTDGGNLQGCAIDLPNVEPWPESVSGSSVLQEISDTFSRFLALPPGAATAMTLWVAHAHCLDCFEHSPRLNYTAPEKGCGKTTARDVTSLFVPRQLSTENLTAAVLFRVIESHHPTILADEYDAWIRDNEELRGFVQCWP